MDTFWQDQRYAIRMLFKNPGFTAIVVITLAIGIGATTAVFSVVNAILLKPLAYKDPGRLAVILHRGQGPVAPANFIDWKTQNSSFQDMGAAEYWTPNLTGTDRAEKLWALHITSNILPILGVEPLIGRVFLPEEDQAGKDHEAVLSYGLWQRRFSGSAEVLGREIVLDGESYKIVGVMPPSFKFAPFWATKAELWAPLPLASRAGSRGGNSLRVFARLKPGVTLAQAQADMTTIADRLEAEFPGTNRAVKVVSLNEKVVGSIRPALLVLMAAVAFVLLIACANVAHMLLSRAAARANEVAIRAALGAGKLRLVRQFLTESVLLAVMGGGAGLLLALWGVRTLVALSPATLPRAETSTVDARVLTFGLAVSIATGIIFGLAPALRASAVNLSGSLKEGFRGSTEGIARNRVRSLLVASEFALAMILLAGAGLMIRSMAALQAIDPGFDPHQVLSMVVSVAGTRSEAAGRRAPFYTDLLDRVRALAGVQSVGAINHLPLAGDLWDRSFWVDGRPQVIAASAPDGVYRVVMPGYFETMKIPILRGRSIQSSDDQNSPAVVIINQALADQYFSDEDPIGKRISLQDPATGPRWITVVGVAKNARQERWAEAPDAEMYFPYLQDHDYLGLATAHFDYLTLTVRTAGEPAALITAVQNTAQATDKNVTVSEVQTMDQVVSAANAGTRFYLMLLGAFAAVALLLAAVGIYGVMSYSVSRRRHEIGIRMTLGARTGQVFGLVVLQGLTLAVAGSAAGLAGAMALTRLMSSLLYGVRPNDFLTFCSVSGVLLMVAVLATYVPARRATRVDPMEALRYE